MSVLEHAVEQQRRQTSGQASHRRSLRPIHIHPVCLTNQVVLFSFPLAVFIYIIVVVVVFFVFFSLIQLPLQACDDLVDAHLALAYRVVVIPDLVFGQLSDHGLLNLHGRRPQVSHVLGLQDTSGAVAARVITDVHTLFDPVLGFCFQLLTQQLLQQRLLGVAGKGGQGVNVQGGEELALRAQCAGECLEIRAQLNGRFLQLWPVDSYLSELTSLSVRSEHGLANAPTERRTMRATGHAWGSAARPVGGRWRSTGLTGACAADQWP